MTQVEVRASPAPGWDESIFTQVWGHVEYSPLVTESLRVDNDRVFSDYAAYLTHSPPGVEDNIPIVPSEADEDAPSPPTPPPAWLSDAAVGLLSAVDFGDPPAYAYAYAAASPWFTPPFPFSLSFNYRTDELSYSNELFSPSNNLVVFTSTESRRETSRDFLLEDHHHSSARAPMTTGTNFDQPASASYSLLSRELRLTFSPRIVRTPEHYRSLASIELLRHPAEYGQSTASTRATPHSGGWNEITTPGASSMALAPLVSQINLPTFSNPSPVNSHPYDWQRSPNAHSRTRKGFWNRGGDHLTDSGYIVYPPPNHAYPQELASYPPQNYRDENGLIASFVRNRPELPDSVSQNGQPPRRPYEKV
ncbi:hypothetical protein V5O48_015428 [Marasmius crinis-equi]|uniref:Uncharacterized protein n=1 Tax=Marasmius crinis-equi TaxID=585013 RepID=A0ABR3EUK1_9AGAR